MRLKKMSIACVIKVVVLSAAFLLSIDAFSICRAESKQCRVNEEKTQMHAKKKFSINEDAGKMGDIIMDQGIVQYEQPSEKKVASSPGMTLYVKAGPDGKSLGDCPFAHFVQMCLQHKRLKYDLKPSVQETKPSWLIEHYEGRMPCLVDKGEAYTESSVIADYIEFFYPEPPLVTADESHKQAMEETSAIFPALAKYIKNLDPAEDPQLQENLFRTLRDLNKLLSESSGNYLCGSSVSLADFSLAPKLYHMQVCLKEFKGIDSLDTEFAEVSAYMNNIFELDAFKKSVYPEDVVIWGWNNARKAE